MKKVWTYLVIAFIALLASVNYELFVFPNQFAPSGINGICHRRQRGLSEPVYQYPSGNLVLF